MADHVNVHHDTDGRGKQVVKMEATSYLPVNDKQVQCGMAASTL